MSSYVRRHFNSNEHGISVGDITGSTDTCCYGSKEVRKLKDKDLHTVYFIILWFKNQLGVSGFRLYSVKKINTAVSCTLDYALHQSKDIITRTQDTLVL